MPEMWGLRRCRHCGITIAESYRRCPHCRGRQAPGAPAPSFEPEPWYFKPSLLRVFIGASACHYGFLGLLMLGELYLPPGLFRWRWLWFFGFPYTAFVEASPDASLVSHLLWMQATSLLWGLGTAFLARWTLSNR